MGKKGRQLEFKKARERKMKKKIIRIIEIRMETIFFFLR